MKMVPLFKCRNMKEAIVFYTGILDFRLKYPDETEDDGVVDIVNGEIELQLTTHENNTLFGSVVNITTDDVDARFARYLERGLDVSGKKNSPVHQRPVDQSWGRREFYVTDADGNTLRFVQPFKLPRAVYKDAFPYVQGRLMNLPVADAAKAA